MRILIQRVQEASVEINQKIHTKIGPGLLIFIGIHKDDSQSQALYLSEKCLSLRIFQDDNQRMNRSIRDIQGDILVMSQFTLYGSCKAGTRPEFTQSAKACEAESLYDFFVDELKKKHPLVKTGLFGKNMQVKLTNDGPVTFIIEK